MTEPGKPLGMSDFFALEAGEYLERLDALLAQTEGEPSGEEYVRLARALRGSALMAQKPAIARAAAGLEAVARALREGRRPWDAATKQLSIRALDDLKVLVRRGAEWTEQDRVKSEVLGAELERAAGGPVIPATRRTADAAPTLDAGARAFVAREGAAIASALSRATQGLRVNPAAREHLQPVMRALQPLRGLAALNDLQPLPDLLEGIERAIGEIERPDFQPAIPAADLFQAADGAIARAAREVAEQGRPNPEAPEFQRFAELLLKLTGAAADAVPIATLFHDDAGPHIVRTGAAPARVALSRLEMVSQGEHLRQAADSLERAPSATQRELRAHTLAGTFRTLANAGGGPLAERVAEFAALARDAIASGVASRDARAFAAVLREVGDLLARSGTGDEAALASELGPMIGRAAQVSSAAARATPAPPAPPRPPSPAPTPAPAEPRAAQTADTNGGGIAAGWTAYERRISTGGIAAAAIDELLRPAGAEPLVVDIGTLLYRGARARARAQQLRDEAGRVTGDQLRKLVDELCDLVALAVEPDT